MPAHEIDTRSVTLVDIPLVKRLTGHGIILDSEVNFTRDPWGTQNALLANIPWWNNHLHTLVTRSDNRRVVGQFRLKPDKHHAQVVYIAPRLEADVKDDTAWLLVLDAMAVEAGRRGSHLLTAEVDEDSQLFETMRNAGYAVYARQSIWRRLPGQTPNAAGKEAEAVDLLETQAGDFHEIQALFCNLVPRLIQQFVTPTADQNGLVYSRDGRIEGYIGVWEGKNGIFLRPCLHPDVYSEAPGVLEAAVKSMGRADKVPVYICVRRYQDWLDEALIKLGFEQHVQQAVMVKHLAAGVRQASFAPLHQKFEAVPRTARPPTRGVTKTSIEFVGTGVIPFDGTSDY